MSGIGLDDGLAVQFQHNAQHAVRGRVLRTHVQGHALAPRHATPRSGFQRLVETEHWVGMQLIPALRYFLFVLITVLVAVHRIIFAQRVPFPIASAS